MRLSTLMLIALMALFRLSYGQCPNAGFILSDTLCSGNSVTIQNTATGAVAFEWDFCSGDLTGTPTTTSVVTNPIVNCYSSSLVEANGNFFLFGYRAPSTTTGIWRASFGASLLNVPQIEEWGNPGGELLAGSVARNFKMVQGATAWYGMTLQGTNKLVRYEFANGPGDTITGVQSYTGLGLNSPQFLTPVQNGDSLYLLVCNAGGTLNRIGFGQNWQNAPFGLGTYSTPGNINFREISLIKICNNWYGFAQTLTGVLWRLEFGSSPMNLPQFTEIGQIQGMSDYRGQSLVYDDGRFIFFTHSFGTLYRIDFGADIQNVNPVTTTFASMFGGGAIGGVNPVKVGSQWFVIGPNASSGTIWRVSFPDNCQILPALSNVVQPVVNFPSPGIFTITQTAIDGVGNRHQFAKTVVVKEGPTVGFSAPDTVCTGIELNLQNNSTFINVPITNYVWDFGNSDTSPQQNPVYAYPGSGLFPVTLTAFSQNGCVVTAYDTILVLPSPIADFSYTLACQNESVSFTDLSSAPGSSLQSWNWQFPGGGTSAQQNPDFVFSTSGLEDVTLQVIAANGCFTEELKSVQVSAKPVFDIDFRNTCVGDVLQILNSSFVPGSDTITAYFWDFGGSQYTIANPQHSFAGVGTYSVIHAAAVSNGCSDTIVLPVKVGLPPVPDFSFGTICEGNSAQFLDLSTGTSDTIYRWLWDFGTGDSSSQQNPLFSFPAAGSYAVRLTAISPSYCDSSVVKTVEVLPAPVVSFTADTVCAGTPATFQNLTTIPPGFSISDWHWDFGDGQTETFFQGQHIFLNGGSFQTSLTATSDSGCTTTGVLSVLVKERADTDFQFTTPGCGSTVVNFSNSSNVPFGYSITSYSWSFGDGDTASVQNPVHVYSGINQYQISLITTLNNGCLDTANKSIELFGAAFSHSDTLCTGNLLDLSTQSAGALSYSWDFCAGDLDKTPSTTQIASNPIINCYSSSLVEDNGNFYLFGYRPPSATTGIWRASFGNSLLNSPLIEDWENPGGELVSGSVARNFRLVQDSTGWYGITLQSSNKLVVYEFANGPGDSITGVQTYTGLGLNTPNFLTPFTIGGSYHLLACNSGGTVNRLSFGSGYQNPPVGLGTYPTPGNVNFREISLIKDCGLWYGFAITLTNVLWRLDFGSTPLNVPQFTEIGPVPGLSDYRGQNLIREDGKYYFFTHSGGTLIRVDFGGDILNTTPVTTSFTSMFGGGAIGGFSMKKIDSKWYAIGPNSSSSTLWRVAFPDSCHATVVLSDDYQPEVTYNTPGVYQISHSAVDSLGNVSQTMRTLIVKEGPIMAFDVDTLSCYGQELLFNNQTTFLTVPITGYVWDFGNGDTSHHYSPVYSYDTSGVFNISLTVSNADGCNVSRNRVLTVRSTPLPDFTYNVACERDTVFFTNTSTIFQPGNIVSWFWDLGNGVTSSDFEVFTSYDTSAAITVSLIAVADNGCADTLSTPIVVRPKPQFNIEVRNTCQGQTTSFINATTVPGVDFVYQWNWDFGGGNTSSLSEPVHNFGTQGLYQATVTALVTNGCHDSLVVPVKIGLPPVADFSVPLLCEGNPAQFTDLSVAVTDSVIGWYWDFGTGTGNSSQQNPVYSFPGPGSYQVTLTAIAPSYCTGSITKTVDVLHSPVNDFTVDTACFGSASTFTDLSVLSGSGTITDWFWSFGDGLGSAAQNPMHTYGNPGIYLVSLQTTSSEGCLGLVSKNVMVRELPVPVFTHVDKCAGIPTFFYDFSTVAFGDSITGFFWSFGDNQTATVRNPQHVYANSGPYHATLTVTTFHGCENSVSDTVWVKPSVNPQWYAENLCLGDSARFSDVTPNSTNFNWYWDFGDGSGNSFQQSPSYYYPSPGDYTVKMVVTNSEGCVDTAVQILSVFTPPVVDFSTDPGCIGQPYQFNDLSQTFGDIVTNWNWIINQSDTATQSDVEYVFSDLGTYPVALTITTQNGCVRSAVKTVDITGPPIADFTFNPPFGGAPLPVTFSDLSIGADAWYWNFGDDNYSQDQNPVHVYSSNQTYVIQLIAATQFGCYDTISREIDVIDAQLDIAVDRVEVSQILLNDGNYLMEVSARVTNLGTRRVYNYDILAKLGDGSTISESWEGELRPGMTMVYKFRASFLISTEYQETALCVFTQKPNSEADEVPANDIACITLKNEIRIELPYPNPASSQAILDLVLPVDADVQVTAWATSGEQVGTLFDGKAVKGLNRIQFSVDSWARGIYFLKVRHKDTDYILRLMVQR